MNDLSDPSSCVFMVCRVSLHPHQFSSIPFRLNFGDCWVVILIVKVLTKGWRVIPSDLRDYASIWFLQDSFNVWNCWFFEAHYSTPTIVITDSAMTQLMPLLRSYLFIFLLTRSKVAPLSVADTLRLPSGLRRSTTESSPYSISYRAWGTNPALSIEGWFWIHARLHPLWMVNWVETRSITWLLLVMIIPLVLYWMR